MPEASAHRILVVDDDPATVRLLQQVLSAEGHTVVSAGDGVAAVDQVNRQPPDLILLDLSLPHLDGYQVCHRIKQDPATRLIPIVIITGDSAFDAKLRAWELGADDFLAKPFQCVEVVARCRSLLRVKRLVDDLDSAETVMFALAHAVEAKSLYTKDHSERVTRYALELADAVGVAEDERGVLRKGAMLHDIGKISVPDEILDKQGKLTADEYEIVKQHTVEGARILQPLRTMRQIVPLVRSHHERLDGRGYPDGLSGEAIPRLVRILSVADIYDALASLRPYRAPMPHEVALDLLRKNALGGGLDLELVDVFCEIMSARGPFEGSHASPQRLLAPV
jgi:putative two-component system response regulator